MATTARAPPLPAANGHIVGPSKGVPAGNRKKQKRRAKQAAKAVNPDTEPLSPTGADLDYDEGPPYDDDEYEFSDAEQEQYADSRNYLPANNGANGYDAHQLASKKNKKKKKKIAAHEAYRPALMQSRLPDLPANMRGHGHVEQQSIWNTSSQQERQNIRDFWLSLSEDERKSLLRIEKEAVLRKMKQQQKHSCSCTVCGRKRTAIEEELEVLYEGYYEELEQYAHHDQTTSAGANGVAPGPIPHPHAHTSRITAPPLPAQSHHRSSHLHEHLDEEEIYSDDEGDYSDEEDYSEEEFVEPTRGPIPDFFNFGQNLTVKDNLLTVADDLLKNDGRRFIEMMEQLAERRMQRETEAEYAAQNPSHPGGHYPNDAGYPNDDMEASEEFDDDEASYDSQEYDEDDPEDDDDMNALTEEQRMQEGRRMFQIFAARMFEHRVLTAYKEKVAAERQQRLLEELDNETQLEAQREAKKKRDAEKKKDKKKQQAAAKAEEKAKKEAEKAAEEARLREAEEKKQEEARRKKEEQRKKKDEERRKLEEGRLKKEADKLKRQQEEQTRREEAERKAREQKAAEKARKDEARKREKEERDAKEKERKAQEDKERSARDAVLPKADITAPSQPQIAKRPSHTNMVAVPGILTKPATASPKPAVAAPTNARVAPGPTKHRQTSQQGSHASSPRQAQSHTSSAPSKSTSPGSLGTSQTSTHAPKTILQKPVHNHQAPQFVPLPRQDIAPPPGMPHQHQAPQHMMPGMPPMGYPPYQNQPGHMIPGGGRSPMPMFPHAGPPNAAPGRMPSFQAPAVNGVHGPPPGIIGAQGRGAGFPFDHHSPAGMAPPGFGPPSQQHILPIGSNVGSHHAHEAVRAPIGSHSRQQSVNEKPFDATIGQPIARPAPIKRPSSAKGLDEGSEVDDLSKQLGSSALLGDDEPAPLGRRTSQRNGPLDTIAGGFAGSPGSFGAAGSTWNTPFSQNAGLGQQWGSLPQASIPGWNGNAGFGSIGPPAGLHRPSAHGSRPLTIRLAVCQACQRLSGGSAAQDFHDVASLMRQIEIMRPALDAPPTMNEIELICETEGDAQNGGGELDVRRAANGTIAAVRWRSDASAPDTARIGGIGEIGSPLPGKSTPAIGFGAPGMGRVAPGTSSGGWTGHNGGF